MLSFETASAEHALYKAVLESILADDYARESDPHADATSEHRAEAVALAARDLVRAVEALSEDDRPIGWDVDQAAPVAATAVNR